MSSAEAIAELAGPIVVKEVRQGLRSRVFAIFFTLLLVVCVFTALVAFVTAREDVLNGGGTFFGVFLTALSAVTFFVIPFLAFRSMVRELEDETWVILALTGLGARPITRGKWLSALSQAALFASACAPFVLFSYFLNGIDLLQVVTALVMAGVWSALSAAVAIAIAAQAQTKLGRTLAHFVVFGVLGLGTMMGIAFAWALADEGRRMLSGTEAPYLLGGFVLFGSLLTWLVLEGAGASLGLSTEADTRWSRLAMVVLGLVAVLFGVVVFTVTSGDASDAVAGCTATCFFLTIFGVACIGERDGWPVGARFRGLAKPGAARSTALVTGLLLLTQAVYWTLASRVAAPENRLMAIVGVPAYPLLYLSLAVLVSRFGPLSKLGARRGAYVGFIGVVVVGIAVPLTFSIGSSWSDRQWVNLLNPIAGLLAFVDRTLEDGWAMLGVLWTITAAVMVAAGVALVSKDVARR